MTIGSIIGHRMRVQRLTGTPFPTAADAVRHFACVQAQDAPLAAWSLALRSRAATHAHVLAEQRAGAILRTHILRPTWHYVVPEDLRWIQALTGPRVERATAGRRRQLGITTERIGVCFARLARLLAGDTELTRAELTPHLGDLGDGPSGEVLTHLLLMAEIHCVIVSGRPREVAGVVAEHTYALADDVVPSAPSDQREEDEALRLLALRFFRAYGPATDRDLARWASLTLTRVRRMIADLADELVSVRSDGATLHFAADDVAPRPSTPTAVLLPAFDPLVLTSPAHPFPRTATQLDRRRLIAESGGGIVVAGTDDVGLFKRTVSPTEVAVTVRLEAPVSRRTVTAIRKAATALGNFYERPATVTTTT